MSKRDQQTDWINVAEDDNFAWPKVPRRKYPSATLTKTTIPFVRKSFAVNATFINTLNDTLKLLEGTLAEQHTLEEYSGS